MFCFQDEEGELSECVECWSQRQSGQHQGEETVDAVNPVVIVLNLVVHLRLNSYYCGCPLQNNVDLLTIQMLWIVLWILLNSFHSRQPNNEQFHKRNHIFVPIILTDIIFTLLVLTQAPFNNFTRNISSLKIYRLCFVHQSSRLTDARGLSSSTQSLTRRGSLGGASWHTHKHKHKHTFYKQHS